MAGSYPVLGQLGGSPRDVARAVNYLLGLTAIVEDTATNIASKTASINTVGKFAGKQVWDSTNNRLMRASGSLATDPWWIVDGSASVTPA